VVEGRIPLPVEEPSWRSPAAATEDTPADHALGRVVRARIRPGLELTPAWATWDFTVLEVRGARPVYAAIPAAASRTFLDQLERGRLDDLLRRYAASSGGDRILESAEQAARGGLYDRVGEPQTLVPAERTPLFGGPKDKLRRRRDDRDQDRREDQQRQDQGGQGAERPRGQHAGRRWPRGRLGMAVVAGLVAVAVVTTAVVLASRNKKEGPGGQGATTPPVNLAALPLADARLQGEFDAGAPSTVSFEPSCAKGACGGTWHTGNAIAPGEFVPVDAPFTKGDGAYASTTDGPGFCASPDNQKVIRRGAHSIGTYTLTVVGTGVIDGVLRATAVTIAGSETVTPVGPGKAANCTASTFASSATWTLVGETPDPPSAASPDPEAYRAWGSHWSGPFNGYANASVGLLQALQSGQGAGFVAIAAQQVAGQLPGLITAATTAPSPPSAYAAQIQTLLSALAEEAPYAKALENECATQDPDRCSAAAQQWFARGQATLDALGGLPVAPKEIEPSPTP
jgi:hypothetical protein